MEYLSVIRGKQQSWTKISRMLRKSDLEIPGHKIKVDQLWMKVPGSQKISISKRVNQMY